MRHSSPKLYLPRGAVEGLAGWVAFAVLAVSLRGVRWDEDYELAQAVTRAIAYPAGHPLFVFARGLFDIQVYATSALYALTHSADFVCAVRNILFLVATVVPAYVAGTLMSGRALCGHVGAVFVLLGTHLGFGDNPLLQTWGCFFSNSHIGMGYALTTACLVAWRRYRLGYFLVGLMPCVSAGQMPALLGLALVRAVAAAREGRWSDLRDGLVSLTLGFATCGAFALVTWPFHVSLARVGVYAVPGDTQQLWRAFVESGTAMGTAAPAVNTHLAMLLFVLFALAASRVERYRRDFQPWRWMFIYGGFAASSVWGIMAVHWLLGPRSPYGLLGWTPYRMGNHVVVLLVAGLPAIVAATDPLRGGRVAAGLILMIFALVCAVVGPWIHPWLPTALDASLHGWLRGAVSLEGLFFFMCGAAATLLHAALRDDKPFRVRWTIAAFGTLIVVGMQHRFGAPCILAGVIARVGVDRFLRRLPHQHERLQLMAVRGHVLAVVTALVLAALVAEQWHGQQWLPRTAFERQVAVYLLRHEHPDAPIVARPDQFSMQACINHPILANLALPACPVSRPALGPSIARLYGEIYAIHFDTEPGTARHWTSVWRERGREEWMRLAKTYGFQYVIAPNYVGLDISSVLIGETESLYEVPE